MPVKISLMLILASFCLGECGVKAFTINSLKNVNFGFYDMPYNPGYNQVSVSVRAFIISLSHNQCNYSDQSQ